MALPTEEAGNGASSTAVTAQHHKRSGQRNSILHTASIDQLSDLVLGGGNGKNALGRGWMGEEKEKVEEGSRAARVSVHELSARTTFVSKHRSPLCVPLCRRVVYHERCLGFE